MSVAQASMTNALRTSSSPVRGSNRMKLTSIAVCFSMKGSITNGHENLSLVHGRLLGNESLLEQLLSSKSCVLMRSLFTRKSGKVMFTKT